MTPLTIKDVFEFLYTRCHADTIPIFQTIREMNCSNSLKIAKMVEVIINELCEPIPVPVYEPGWVDYFISFFINLPTPDELGKGVVISPENFVLREKYINNVCELYNKSMIFSLRFIVENLKMSVCFIDGAYSVGNYMIDEEVVAKMNQLYDEVNFVVLD